MKAINKCDCFVYKDRINLITTANSHRQLFHANVRSHLRSVDFQNNGSTLKSKKCHGFGRIEEKVDATKKCEAEGKTVLEMIKQL